MKQINCGVVGTATDIPTLLIDTGHGYPGTFENPHRVIFMVSDSEPPWGATFLYGGKSLRYVLPATPGAYEGPALDYGPPPPLVHPLHTEGTLWVTDQGKPWTMSGHCDFLVHKRFIEQGEAAVHQILDGRKPSTCLSTLEMWHFGERFYPSDYGDAFFHTIKPLARLLGSRGFYWVPIIFADWQVLGAILGNAQAWIERWAREIAGEPNILPSLINEYQKNGLDPLSIVKPSGTGCLWSRGSSFTDSGPSNPGWDWKQWEGRRDAKAQFGSMDGYYVMNGIEEGSSTPYDRAMPTAQTETIGFWTNPVPGRRSNDPRLARIIGGTSVYYMRGGLVMTEETLTSRPWEPRTNECTQQFFLGLKEA